METELQQFNAERAERIRLLREKHEKQLEAFDQESTRMGFRYTLMSLKFYSYSKLFIYFFFFQCTCFS